MTLDLHSQSPVSSVAFQPPQWAINGSPKEEISRTETFQENSIVEKSSSPSMGNLMGIFSPVNKSNKVFTKIKKL